MSSFSQKSLFADEEKNGVPIVYALPDGELLYSSSFFSKEESDALFQILLQQIPWKQDEIILYQKKMLVPRLSAWYGDMGKNYSYSNIQMNPHPWTKELLYIKRKIEPLARVVFNGALLNLYRYGQDSVSWHSDDEPELGINPLIASVSFGAVRCFQMKHKFSKETEKEKFQLDLEHGSVLLMRDKTQHHWVHQIPKTKKDVGVRINITFRVIHPT